MAKADKKHEAKEGLAGVDGSEPGTIVEIPAAAPAAVEQPSIPQADGEVSEPLAAAGLRFRVSCRASTPLLVPIADIGGPTITCAADAIAAYKAMNGILDAPGLAAEPIA